MKITTRYTRKEVEMEFSEIKEEEKPAICAVARRFRNDYPGTELTVTYDDGGTAFLSLFRPYNYDGPEISARVIVEDPTQYKEICNNCRQCRRGLCPKHKK